MIYCVQCGNEYPSHTKIWRCSCKGELKYKSDVKTYTFRPEYGTYLDYSIWRYRKMLPHLEDENIVTLGEGLTPVIPVDYYNFPVWFKLDFLCPTGSYKDRGTSVMISHLKQMGVESVVEDSSGNAGASVAAYAKRAGMECEIFVPAKTSKAKLTQIRAYGGKIKPIDGSRQDVAEACQKAAGDNSNNRIFYASHNWNPFFLEGMKTLAYQIFEQCTKCNIMPDWIVVPAGYGSLVLGVYEGFVNIMSCSELTRLPKLVIVQAENCPPIHKAFIHGKMKIPPIQGESTIAEGIACSAPIRGIQILDAIKNSNGLVVAVKEKEIEYASIQLAHHGIFIEPTSAVVGAALARLIDNKIIKKSDIVLGILTGIGLKTGYYYDGIIN